MLDKFNKKNLHLAELKYFDMQHNGIEVTEPVSFVILYGNEVQGQFFNVLQPLEELPTFQRVPGTTNSYGNEYFGTKVRVLTEECSTGPCWLLCEKDVRLEFPGDIVTRDEIEEYVLSSPLYFKDRLDIARERLVNFKQPFRMAKIVRADKPREHDVDEFFRIRNNDRRREYIKTNRDW